MARYGRALLDGGVSEHGRVLRPETLELMWSPHYRPDPGLPGIGLAFFLDRPGGHQVVGHDGNLPGFATGLLLAPDEGWGWWPTSPGGGGSWWATTPRPRGS